jgi:hypothetical protein
VGAKTYQMIDEDEPIPEKAVGWLITIPYLTSSTCFQWVYDFANITICEFYVFQYENRMVSWEVLDTESAKKEGREGVKEY